MRAPIALIVVVLGLAAGTASAGPAALPPLDPAQKTCALKALGKKAYARAAAARGPLPAAVRSRIAHCLKQRPRPDAPAAPAGCPATFRLPVDLALVTSVGAPGQVRGGAYKGHGYFRVASNDTAVSLPVAATLYEGGRYVEAGEIQYLLYFRTGCGTILLFDHVLQPSAAVLAAFAGKPEAKPDDSRTYPLPAVAFAAGAPVADAVGFRSSGNAAFDFGLYDPAKANVASTRPGFRGNASLWRDANALCWYDLFGSDAAARIRALSAAGSVEGAASDVCG